jgi:hypothetical protein
MEYLDNGWYENIALDAVDTLGATHLEGWQL